MKKRWKKLLVAFVCALLLTQGLITSVVAATKNEDEITPIEWELSEDERTLYGNGKTYTRYSLAVDAYLDAATVYIYQSFVTLEDEGSLPVYAATRNAEFVWIEEGEFLYLYATKQGAEMLDEFGNGSPARYRLESYSNLETALISNATVKAIDNGWSTAQSITVPVSNLKGLFRYHLVAYDESDTLAYIHGAVYEMDGEFYYINYQKLGNQYFDANGNFSYRNGEVEMILLEGTQRRDVLDAIDKQSERVTEYEWESHGIEHTGMDASVGVFWIALVIFGLLLPIPFLVFGLALPNSKKRGYPKYWYTLAIIVGVWLLIAIVLAAIVLFI